MREKLKYWITLLYNNARKEFSERPIATIGVLVALIGVLPSLLLSESLRDFVGYLLSIIFLPQIEASLFPLIIALIALLVVAYHSSQKIQKKKNHYFIDYADFTWKIYIYPLGPYVDQEPHCKKHRVRMVSVSNETYVCPLCGNAGAIKISYKRLNALRELVQNLADAKSDEHLQV
jgi:hypothetical protein